MSAARHIMRGLVLVVGLLGCRSVWASVLEEPPLGRDAEQQITQLENRKLQLARSLAGMMQARGQYGEATRYSMEALRLDPTDERRAYDLLALLRNVGRWKDILYVHEVMLELGIGEARSHAMALSEAARQLYPPEVAIRALEHALELLEPGDKKRGELLGRLAEQYRKGGSLDPIAQRLRRYLEPAAPDPRYEGEIRGMLFALKTDYVVRGRYADLLDPLVDHPEERIALMAVEALGDNCSPILFGALKSKRPQLVEVALGHATCGCPQHRHADQLHELVRAIFDGDNDSLKLRAAGILRMNYDDPDALGYLLHELGSDDRERVQWALGGMYNFGGKPVPPPPGLVEALTPLLQSDDEELRRSAAFDLSGYASDEVVEGLARLLADDDPRTVRIAMEGLWWNMQMPARWPDNEAWAKRVEERRARVIKILSTVERRTDDKQLRQAIADFIDEHNRKWQAWRQANE